uniref:C-type lectin domain family 17, member A-like n=1 Tax=Drosophila rhopaloa TaxID=1041015 RepID=A0A6P4FMP8_DRORH
MCFKISGLFTVLGLFSLAGAYRVIPNIEDGIIFHEHDSTSPFVKIGNGFYYFEPVLEKNWYAAFESCRRMDADLISFDSIEEWNAINQYILSNKIDHLYWTSGTDFAENGKHKWFTTGEPITLNIWNEGEPNNLGLNEHCDEMGKGRTENNYNVLNDKSCYSERLYICKTRQPKTASFLIW